MLFKNKLHFYYQTGTCMLFLLIYGTLQNSFSSGKFTLSCFLKKKDRYSPGEKDERTHIVLIKRLETFRYIHTAFFSGLLNFLPSV